MNKGKGNIVFLIVAVLLIVGLAVFLYFRKNKQNSGILVDTPAPAYNPPIFPLKKGSRGAEVKKLQEWINEQAQYVFLAPVFQVPNVPLETDGIWGEKTNAALEYMSSRFSEVKIPFPAVDEAFYKLFIQPLKRL